MQIVELSDGEEEAQHGGANGFESSDEDEYVVDEEADDEDGTPNGSVVDEQADYASSDEYNTDDEDEERDPNEEDEIFDYYVETVRQFVQPCGSLGAQGWATEFTFRTVENDNRIEDIGDLVNIVLRKLIRDAKRNALERGYHGGWIGVAWGTELMESCFFIPYGHEEHNNPRKLLTAFEQFDQSAKENDLYGQIVRVQVSRHFTYLFPPPNDCR